jgi:hypothetical protein
MHLIKNQEDSIQAEFLPVSMNKLQQLLEDIPDKKQYSCKGRIANQDQRQFWLVHTDRIDRSHRILSIRDCKELDLRLRGEDGVQNFKDGE